MTTEVTAAPRRDASPWHSIGVDEALRGLGSDGRSGLATAEVTRRLDTYGPNQLSQRRRRRTGKEKEKKS